MTRIVVSAHFSYAIESEDLASWMDAGGQTTEEDSVPAEFQRANRAGPDYDPAYFEKLDALVQEGFGDLGELKPIST
ncbi:hypothetical protein J2T09_003007 [Neorhizobium huautlense]|uniref:Uncharacterized protein n=1 Tax=Neorhizobium huautlense TaxID=67774 RepID=A0ABT9PUU5_9HYPH|nr:hypothetical protein [Neorhizobium huautlense]MDP9838240.1 hypothetical protein [Neorhizobium huautlense]